MTTALSGKVGESTKCTPPGERFLPNRDGLTTGRWAQAFCVCTVYGGRHLAGKKNICAKLWQKAWLTLKKKRVRKVCEKIDRESEGATSS